MTGWGVYVRFFGYSALADGAGGADADTDTAAHTIQRGHGHGVLVNVLALAGLDVHDPSGSGSLSGLLGSQSEGTDGGLLGWFAFIVA